MKKVTTYCFAIFCLLLLSVTVIAQQTLTTPADLRNACQTNPGNIVTISQSTKISLPVLPYTPEQVNCGCTVILNNGATFEFEQANLQFAGAFTVQSTDKGEVKFTKSSLKATTISLNLTATGSSVGTSQSQLQASAGNVTIALGQQAKMELYGRFSSSSFEGLSATGVISINAGERFTASVSDMSVIGQQGVQINATGFETSLKLGLVGFRSIAGSINITASGDKSNLEVDEANFFSKNETNIIFSGNETGVKLGEAGFFGPTINEPSIGGVSIVAAGGNNSMGKIEMVELSTGLINGGFSVSSAVNGTKGGIKMEKSALRANGEIRFETGRDGSTEVKENSLTSLTKILIKTGAGGSCIASPNRTLSAPVVEACLPTLAAARNQNSATEINPTIAASYSLYPNPGINGTVNVNFKNFLSSKDIILTDLNGRIVKQWKNFTNNHLKISNLYTGYYNLQVINSATGEKSSDKIIITN